MRHISMFRLKDEARTPEIVGILAQGLRDIPNQVPFILQSEVGEKPFPMPTQSPDGLVQFYDLVQIITFASEEDCKAYPTAQGHLDFVQASGLYIDQVVGIDYPVE
jgi:hypothetical protein